MKTFGQVIREAHKSVGLTQKGVAERLRRGDGRKVLPLYLNDLEHDRRYPPEDAVIEQLAKILQRSPDVLYFYAKRVPGGHCAQCRRGTKLSPPTVPGGRRSTLRRTYAPESRTDDCRPILGRSRG
jgi:transcriptional regulator with XRE-family HTH domain